MRAATTVKSNIRKVTVQGTEFTVWSDFIDRATYARNDATGEFRTLKTSGYIHNELAVRKAIACCFGLDSFRK